MSVETAAELRAKLTSPGEWGTYGNAEKHTRYAKQITTRGGRSKCGCGCGGRVTHTGMANGLGMTSGCEWSIRRWVRDPHEQARQWAERYEAARVAKPNGAVRCSGHGCAALVARPVGWTLASARKALRERGWTRGADGDLCPAHSAAQPTGGEQ